MIDFPSESPSPEIPHADAGKGTTVIAGAGTIGMAILIVSLSVLFIATMFAFLFIRIQIQSQSPGWPPPGMPRIPASLWFSTLVILVTSVTVQIAFNAIRCDLEKKLTRFLWATFLLGLLFLLLQSFAWWEFYRGIGPDRPFNGSYLGGFYILTGLHAAHVIGGLIPLAVVMHRAAIGRYSRNFHPGVRYVTVYWHFLDVIWCLLFGMIYF